MFLSLNWHGGSTGMDVLFFSENEDYWEVLKVLQQLRPQYELTTLAQQVEKQMQQGYNLVYVKSGSDILAVSGFVVGEKLAWGKYIYVDDLVTNELTRSDGVGKYVIDWLKEYAQQQGCEQIHLDSGVQRFGAHRFYLRERFTIASHHFSLTDVSSTG